MNFDDNLQQSEKQEKKKLFKRPLVVIILVILMLLIGIICGFVFNMRNNSDNNKTSFSDVKDKKVGSFTFENISSKKDGDNSVITYTIVNDSKEKVHLGEYDLIIMSADGEIVANIRPNYDIDLEPGEKFEASNTINIDIPKDAKIDIKLKEKEN